MTANAFVIPTQSDVRGLVINEEMAFGLPVTATDKYVAGVKLLENGVHGYIVPAADINSLSTAIARLVSDQRARSHMSTASLERARRYTIEKMPAAHHEAFRNHTR